MVTLMTSQSIITAKKPHVYNLCSFCNHGNMGRHNVYQLNALCYTVCTRQWFSAVACLSNYSMNTLTLNITGRNAPFLCTVYKITRYNGGIHVY